MERIKDGVKFPAKRNNAERAVLIYKILIAYGAKVSKNRILLFQKSNNQWKW